jgi:hypothetical protein
MRLKEKNHLESWASILLGVFAILAIKSIFENDNSKIVSKKGRRFLHDKDKMKEINKKVSEFEHSTSSVNKEIFI